MYHVAFVAPEVHVARSSPISCYKRWIRSPRWLFATTLLAQLQNRPVLAARSRRYARDEEGYWTELRKQFLIPEDEIYLNNGTVGSSPAPVLRAVFDGYTSTEKLDETDPEDYPIWG